MQQRKIPMRTCVGCMANRPKRELVRVVRSAEGILSIDPVGKKPGRGAYLCPNPECLVKAQKKKALERALETTVTPEVLEQLRVQLSGEGGGANG